MAAPRLRAPPGCGSRVGLPCRLCRRCPNTTGRHWVKRRSSWPVWPAIAGQTGHDDLAGPAGAVGRGHSGRASPERNLATATRFTTQNWSHPCTPLPRAGSATRLARICPWARLGTAGVRAGADGLEPAPTVKTILQARHPPQVPASPAPRVARIAVRKWSHLPCCCGPPVGLCLTSPAGLETELSEKSLNCDRSV